ncbi:Restriction endonuclease fold toxin 7 [Nocardia amikacinitolerans]|uniref:putative toxin n=1 Tax=Nocardia amikacinitolerans TaxID=756689 RepID=UPI0020A60E3A|nr:putative toxin [Nocardia amikacinitolerans]MCP2299382.1 Restriction endonuclease fold toxin 7 [Nocardia amikacinitolerans]
MGDVDPAAYYAAAARLIQASLTIEKALRELNKRLEDVLRSAGHHEAGVLWSTSYDQSASDVFELASFCAMAARELGYQVHGFGLIHDMHEHANNPTGPPFTPPAQPQGTSLSVALHPSKISAGGTGDKPEHWDYIAELVTKKWPDAKVAAIAAAGAAFESFGTGAETDSYAMYDDVKAQLADQTEPEIDGVLQDLVWLATAYRDTGDAAKALRPACVEVSSKTDTERQQVQAILNSLHASLLLLEGADIGAELNPTPAGRASSIAIELQRKEYRERAASDFDTLMRELEGFVATAINSNKGIYAIATASAGLLRPILGRTPRKTDPIHNGGGGHTNEETGRRGEERADVPPGPKRSIPVNGHDREPDYLNVPDQQLTEVKNKNQLDRSDTEQITDYLTWADGNGYSVILVVDHRTQLTPGVEKLVQEGKITLIRKELDDGDGH